MYNFASRQPPFLGWLLAIAISPTDYSRKPLISQFSPGMEGYKLAVEHEQDYLTLNSFARVRNSLSRIDVVERDMIVSVR